jgi:hypothetical protein
VIFSSKKSNSYYLQYRELARAVESIERAIVEEGKMPEYHKSVMKRHRDEWGTLHNAIDNAIKVLHKGK